MWLVVGASGYFGSYFCKEILEDTNERIVATHFKSIPATESQRIEWVMCDLVNDNDLQNLKTIIERDDKSDLKVIILSATHHPDVVKKNFQKAATLNFIGLTQLLNILPANAAVWYVSSDVVYGESKHKYFYKEVDCVSPINAYGKQKVVCEHIVLSYGHNVARCSFLIGPSRISRPHFYDEILEAVSAGREIAMIEDQYRSVIDFAQAAKLIRQLTVRFASSQVGIVNVGADLPMSKYEVALSIARKFNRETQFIKPIAFDSSDFFVERRGKDILLDNGKLKSLLGLSEISCKF